MHQPTVFCGIDWASDHHDIAVIDASGSLLARARIDDTAAGLAQLLQILAEHGDHVEQPVPVAIETSRGLLVACLRATGRRIYAINPLAVARYRERHTLTRKKSDHLDAMTLANILRTDAAAHRELPADTVLDQRPPRIGQIRRVTRLFERRRIRARRVVRRAGSLDLAEAVGVYAAAGSAVRRGRDRGGVAQAAVAVPGRRLPARVVHRVGA